MELTQEVSPKRNRLALIGAAVALTAALLVPTIGRTAGTAQHDTVVPVHLTTSATTRSVDEKRLEMQQAFSRLHLQDTTSVCLPCIVRQHPTQVVGGRPA